MSDPRTLDVYAAQTDSYTEMMDREAAKDPMIARFIAACPPGGLVLDLGCGAGQYARRMAEAGLRVEAIDAVPAMVTRANAYPGVKARQGRFTDVAGTAVYDGIWAYFSLLHAPRSQMDGHLAAIARALKPGGALFIGLKRGAGGGRDKLGRYYEYYELPELEDRLTRAGLALAEHWTGIGTGLAANPEGWIVIEAHA